MKEKHSRGEKQNVGMSPSTFESTYRSKSLLIPRLPSPCFVSQFSHFTDRLLVILPFTLQ